MSHVSSVTDSRVKLVIVKYVYIFQWSSNVYLWRPKAANPKHIMVFASKQTQKGASGPQHLERDALTRLQRLPN